MKYAKDELCIDCGKQAEVFWPMVDPDIPSYPYCKTCVRKRQFNLLKKILKEDTNE